MKIKQRNGHRSTHIKKKEKKSCTFPVI
uniref:Uncharacterized protein n=1 Tax=Anguilla anguilla TaxID=7936 RepID=A0A0E9XC21_ANGAN